MMQTRNRRRRRTGELLAVLALAVAVAGGTISASRADDRHDEGRRYDDHRGRERRDEGRRDDEWRHRDYHPYAYGAPPVVVGPPVQAPALSFVFPLNFR